MTKAIGRPRGIPNRRLHKPSGRDVVTIDGRDHYLGPHDSEAAKRNYDRLIGEWMIRGRQGTDATKPESSTVSTLCCAYLATPKGKRHIANSGFALKHAVRWLTSHYGDLAAKDFGCAQLEALRAKMCVAPYANHPQNGRTLSRRYINRMIARMQEIFDWAARRGYAPQNVSAALEDVERLRPSDKAARETSEVLPVRESDLNAVLGVAGRIVKTMIQVQRLTGMRSGELCRMRTIDLDMSDDSGWWYLPPQHKTAHLNKTRSIFIGPKARELLRPLLRTDTLALFSPLESKREHLDKQRAEAKKRPRQAHELKGLNPAYWKTEFSVSNYCKAIGQLCDKADREAREREQSVPAAQRIVERWHPHQLRHNAADQIRTAFGIEVARAVLGHSTSRMTEQYLTQDREAARRALSQIG